MSYDPARETLSSLDNSLAALRAMAEETRLRILALLSGGELSVSDLTEILGQSQPRISRHLKLLAEAGLVERHREGAWAFYRLAEARSGGALVQAALADLDPGDARIAGDRQRLDVVRARRSAMAQTYFGRIATRWDELRSLHAAEAAVEGAIVGLVADRPYRTLLDLGTGTGRMLQLLGPGTTRSVGLDSSHAMLAVARANLERAGLARVELRQGDILAPPLWNDVFDLVTIHQVLHYLDDPGRAVAAASRLVAPGGRLLIVDFAPHGLEFLREREAHRRLGFASEQVAAWFAEAGLEPAGTHHLPPPSEGADMLTVSLWLGQDRRAGARTDTQAQKEVA